MGTGRGNVTGAKARRAKAVRMKIEGASYAEIKVACGYNSLKYCREEVRDGLKAYWAQDFEEKQQLLALAMGRLDRAQRVAMKLIRDPDVDARDRTKAMDSLTALLNRQARFQALDAKPTADDDGNAVDLWLIEVGGQAERPTELSDADEDEPEYEDGDEDLDDEDDE
ncbi:hypothetical protein ACIO14_14890 [Nocardia fluminea]|uniref:hypothetical protein n=1 Tax=Nocardia fluminea TaxID=134984 RepID=UPI00380861A4